MNQIGTVLELIDPSSARVSIQKHTDCGHCHACDLGQKNELVITALNPLKAKPGDEVEISLETQNVFMAAFLAYGIPFIGLLAGILIGIFIFDNETYAILLGFACLALSYFYIKVNDNKFRKSKKYVPYIVKILGKH